MKTIIIGYADSDGLGKPVLVCGPNMEPQKQAAIMDDAANRQKFVKDFKRLEYIVLPDGDPAQIAIYLGDEVAKSVADSEAKAKELAKQRFIEQSIAIEEAAKLQAYENRAKDLAAKRNEILGAKHQAEVKFRNLNATPSELRDSSYASLVDEIKTLLNGDPQKKIEGLNEQAIKAISDYEKAFQEWQALLKPTNAAEVPAQKRQMNL